MNDAGDPTGVKLAELLRHPDDLDKIMTLKADFTRKKATVDAQLKLGLKEQLQLTQAGMTSIKDGQSITAQIKEEMLKIDRLCAESQTMIYNFPEINAVAQAHRNFAQVESMKASIDNFAERLKEVNFLIEEDSQNLEQQPNLLQIHHGISQLRKLRDDSMEQAKKADDASIEKTLQDWFAGLDDAIEDFDEHVGQACINLIPLVTEGNSSLVVRLAVVIEEEEKFDERIKEIQEAQREFKDLAPRFKSLAAGATEVRGYKDKFLQAITLSGQEKIEQSNEAFMDDPDKLEKSLRWYFNDLNAVKLGMQPLMPKKWKIFRTYVRSYHQLMYDWLSSRAADNDVTPTHMLAIVHWKDKYYHKMNRLGAEERDMNPPLPGGHDSDLVREYRQLIVDKVEEWMNQINKTDRQSFLERSESALDHDEHGLFRSKTLGDMWRMLREQLVVASTSDLTDVIEGVVDAMYRALKTRADMWHSLIDDEVARYQSPQAEYEGIQGLQDWLIALGNDQIASIQGGDETSETPSGYLEAFKADYDSVVSRDYVMTGEQKFDTMRDAMTDLGVKTIRTFVKLMFAVDFRNIMTEFFTASWYSKKGMGQIITTFEDYLGDYSEVLHPLLLDVLVEELGSQLLTAYLGAVRNKGAKFRAGEPYLEKIRDDLSAVFAFFSRYPDFPKDKWRAIDDMMALVQTDRHALANTFALFMQQYWDLKLSWVEAVLRARDDIDWSPLGEGKSIMKALRAQAAEIREEGGEPTPFGDLG